MASIFGLLIIALVLGALILGIVLWITGGPKGNGEMSCGACGYAVRGLEALNCPECGADLRTVGINRPKGGAGRTAGIVITIVTSLLILTCLGSSVFLAGSNTLSTPTSIQAVPAHPSILTQPAQPAASPNVTTNPDGSTTLTNPDGSTITTHADGSTTLVQPDGTTTSFDSDGVEIETPQGSDNEDTSPTP